MNDRDLNLRDAFSAPDTHFHAATQRALNQICAKQFRGTTFAPRRGLLIAALLLAVLAATGFATGAFQSIFASIGSQWTEPPASDYAYLDEAAARDVFEQTLDFDSGARATLRLEQSYYNGEQLALGWSLQPEGDFAWFYDAGDARYADMHPNPELQPDGTEIFTDIDLYERIGAERADEFYRRLDEDGWAGVAWYDCYLGDHVDLPGVPGVVYDFDGTTVDVVEDAILDSYSQGEWRQDASDYLYLESDVLPDGARDRNAVSVRIKAYARLMWYCEDASGRYLGESDIESVLADARSATVEVPRCEDFQPRDDQFTAAFPACSVEIALRTTPIHVEFAWESQLPEEWLAICNDPANFPDDKFLADFSEDVFYCCEFYAEVNGELIQIPTYYQTGEFPLRGAGSFVLPEGTNAIHVRPVYYNSGEHPSEEVLFELD